MLRSNEPNPIAEQKPSLTDDYPDNVFKYMIGSDWEVAFHEDFFAEFGTFPAALQDELLAHASVLSKLGPALGRPLVDTLKGSRLRNLKELRFAWRNGAWRVAFAFDSQRRAILLVAGDKTGQHQGTFYRRLLRVAERRFAEHQRSLTKQD